MINKEDIKLIELAKQKAITCKDYDNAPFDTHIVALRAKSGRIFYGMNLFHWYGQCAEPVAISSALLENEIPETLVCIRIKDEKLSFAVPCGNCIQLMLRHCPNVEIILDENLKDTANNFFKYHYNI